MIHLLDVNVLLALAYPRHDLHERATDWLAKADTTEHSLHLATCSITELGFIRVASGAAGWAANVRIAIQDLQFLKKQWPMAFLEDGVPGSQLDDWVQRSKHVTDGHLMQLAAAHGGSVVTLDQGIPGAYLIPALERHSPSVHEPFVPYGGVTPRSNGVGRQQL
ncbi:MAG: VapC toxin family PIN domain ribonuclease [Proteobacteria bacterium]|nr:VapC toxin family PIN domain ribonuclease [Pseudomonadota bacterium]